MDTIITKSDGIQTIPLGSKQGGFWASALGSGLVGGVIGYLAGGGSANRNAIMAAGRGLYPPVSPVGFADHGFGHGLSHFEIQQAEKINRLEIEVAKKDGVIGDMHAVGEANRYSDIRNEEVKRWVHENFIAQPKVGAAATGAQLVSFPPAPSASAPAAAAS